MKSKNRTTSMPYTSVSLLYCMGICTGFIKGTIVTLVNIEVLTLMSHCHSDWEQCSFFLNKWNFFQHCQELWHYFFFLWPVEKKKDCSYHFACNEHRPLIKCTYLNIIKIHIYLYSFTWVNLSQSTLPYYNLKLKLFLYPCGLSKQVTVYYCCVH